MTCPICKEEFQPKPKARIQPDTCGKPYCRREHKWNKSFEPVSYANVPNRCPKFLEISRYNGGFER